MSSVKLKRLKILIKYSPLDILLFFKGVRIKVLKDSKDLEKVFRFRKKIYLQEDFIDEKDVPDVWSDGYDDFSVNIAAFKNGEVVGAMRLVPQKVGTPLPIEGYFRLSSGLPEGCMEFSKLVVDRNFRGRKRLIFYGLIKKAFFLSVDSGKKYWVAFMNDYFCNSLKKFNADSKELETLTLGVKEIARREQMRKYFEKQAIKPYILSLQKIFENNS